MFCTSSTGTITLNRALPIGLCSPSLVFRISGRFRLNDPRSDHAPSESERRPNRSPVGTISDLDPFLAASVLNLSAGRFPFAFASIMLGLLVGAFLLSGIMSAHGHDTRSLLNPRGGLFSAPDLVLGRQFSACQEGASLSTLSRGTNIPTTSPFRISYPKTHLHPVFVRPIGVNRSRFPSQPSIALGLTSPLRPKCGSLRIGMGNP